MIIKNIERKIRLALFTVIGCFLTCLTIVGITLMFAFNMISESNKQIYVLDNGVPLLVNQTDSDVNRAVEYKSHIGFFHMLFFTLPPDDDFMKNNIEKSMYLIDKSGVTEYNNLKEKGYYNAILGSTANTSIRTDSIILDLTTKTFEFYGTQRIERPTSILTKELVTTGAFMDVPRSDNNPHGCLITNWKTILNKDLSNVRKSKF